jgi:transcriptional regulator with XRE-family HTH domain
MIEKSLCDGLKKLRAVSGISQATLADKVGIGQTAVSAYEIGVAGLSVEMLERLAAAMGRKLVIRLEKGEGGEVHVDY